MKNWEDIVKDKLEGYESPLPEGSLAQFRARRNAAGAPAQRNFPLFWVIASAVAAGIVAFLFLRQPDVHTDAVQLVQQSGTPVATLQDSSEISEPTQPEQAIAQLVTPSTEARISSIEGNQAVSSQENPEENKQDIPSVIGSESTEIPSERTEEEVSKEETIPESSSVILPIEPPSAYKNNKGVKPAKIKVSHAVGALGGGGLLAALVASGTGGNKATYANAGNEWGPYYDNNYNASFSADQIIGKPTHSFPLKIGLSTRVPLAQKLYITTGVEYSLYKSTFTYSLSGEHRQTTRYLGVPLRLDWSVASGRLVDLYIGGGIQGDICIGATMAGHKIKKDRPSLSLQGAGGLQLNFAKHLGLYIEPQLNWRAFHGKTNLDNYRNQHPVTFSASAGLRINL